MAVWRKGFEVWRLDLSKPAYDFLGALAKGRPFGKAVEAAARGMQGNPATSSSAGSATGSRKACSRGSRPLPSPRPALRLPFAHGFRLDARVAGGRRPRRVRLGDGVRHPDAALPRPAADGEEPSDGAHGPRQRLRRLRRDRGRTVRHLVAGVRAGRRPSRRRFADRRLRARAVAALDVLAARRHAPLAGDPGSEGRVRGGRRLEAPLGLRARLPRGPPVPVGPRLPLPPPREPGVSLRGLGGAGPDDPVRALSGRARGPREDERRLLSGPRLVPRVRLCRGEGAGARLLGGPGVSRDLPLRPGGGGDPAPGGRGPRNRARVRQRRSRVRIDPASRARAPSPVHGPPRARGRRLPRPPRRGPNDRRRLSRGSPTGAATRSSRCADSASRPGASPKPRGSSSSGRARSRRGCCRTAFPTPASRARVQLGRRLALVRRRRLRLAGDDGRGRTGKLARRASRRCEPRSRRSSTATRAARASASGPTPTGCWRRASRACS